MESRPDARAVHSGTRPAFHGACPRVFSGLNAGKAIPLSDAPSDNGEQYSKPAGRISPDEKALFSARTCAVPSSGQARHSPLFPLFPTLRRTLPDADRHPSSGGAPSAVFRLSVFHVLAFGMREAQRRAFRESRGRQLSGRMGVGCSTTPILPRRTPVVEW